VSGTVPLLGAWLIVGLPLAVAAGVRSTWSP
jgi:hypothetical protein